MIDSHGSPASEIFEDLFVLELANNHQGCVERGLRIVTDFSTHEHRDSQTSFAIAYAKGARTFERHIDLAAAGRQASAYCSLPQQIDEWLKAHKRAVKMCGAPAARKVIRYTASTGAGEPQIPYAVRQASE